MGKKLSEFHKKRLSEGHADFRGAKSPRWTGGKPNCKECGKLLSTYASKTCYEHISRQTTSIEKKVYDYLLLKGILFERQKLIGDKFLVDAYIPSLNLVIEADGDYWHSLDKVIKRDRAKNAYLTKCGFKLLRLTETEIRNDKFKERLVL